MLCASEIDMWVGQSFDGFIDRAQSSKMNTLLHEIAIEPAKGQEGTIENMFLDSLKYKHSRMSWLGRSATKPTTTEEKSTT